MKLVHYILLFLALIFGIFIFYEIVTSRTTQTAITDAEYSTALASAAFDASKTIKTENYEAGKGVWREKEDRLKTINVFFDSLSRSFGLNSTVGEIFSKEKVPVLLLIDNNGFYISYNAQWDDYGNANVPSAYEDPDVLSDINTWSKDYSGIIVRFYLSDYVDVTLTSNLVYSGRRQAVADELIRDGSLSSAISFLADEAAFFEVKNSLIIKRIEDVINYYINTQMVGVNPNLTGYNVSLTRAAGEDWQRLITNPTVWAFIQGSQTTVAGNVLNEFASAAGELTPSTLYFIEGGCYYSLSGNAVVKTTKTVTTPGGETIVTAEYTHNGVPVTNIYTSMEQCAMLGAVPGEGEY